MAEIVLSEEETQAMVDRVLDQVERGLVQRLESDLYRSVVREAAKDLTSKMVSKIQARAETYLTPAKIDEILDRALTDKAYGSVTYTLNEIVREQADEFRKKLMARIEASIREIK